MGETGFARSTGPEALDIVRELKIRNNSRSRTQHAIVAAILPPQIAVDGAQHLAIVAGGH